MNIAEDIDPEDKLAYPNRPAWQRFATIFAGPATNYLSAIILAFGLYTCHGVSGGTAYIGVDGVLPDYDASGKLEPGDRITAVDKAPILAGVGATLRERVAAKNGAPMLITVERAGASYDLSVTPKTTRPAGAGWWDEDAPNVYLLGISMVVQADPVEVGVIDAAGRALVYPIDQSKLILGGLYDIITGAEKADLGGPVRIFDEFKKAFSIGAVPGIKLLMMLSVYLGLFNLLPLPALDGGRLVFLGYELVTRRRANAKIEAMVHMGGIMVLGVLMIVVTLKDLFHVF